ncbi:MAG: deoxyribodipyrimidine photolyase-related protein [Verrucomicrobiales bacterium]|jgi:deoxyribodipyrimidine photolyase-related protein
MADCTLIFPFQLFDPHPALKTERTVVLVEEGLTFGDPHVGIRFHQQKIVLHRAAMRSFAAELENRGFDVHYRDHEVSATIADHLSSLRDLGFDAFHFCDPVDYLLEKRMHRAASRLEIKLHIHETPMFVTPTKQLESTFAGSKRPFMASFYERQRKRMGILLDRDGKPQGGKWSFDESNRKSMPKSGLDVPTNPAAKTTRFTEEAIAYTQSQFKHYHGNAADFSYPISHAAAESWFENFLETRFLLFGDYEDAISCRHRVLFHSVLTPMLNIGLLTPQKVIDRALEFALENATPLNSVEGFIRQIIGWREFICGAYRHLGVQCRTGNFWNFEDKPIPSAFYDATTGIAPIDLTIQRAIDHGWCHHIERLMILGNFMLLCGFHPRRVNDWFMELFVDAYDWVMVPNIFGMSQFADGGIFTTKPYISGSNYVRKMSDFKKGDWCATWDGLFWMFVKNHQEFFRNHHRLAMMARQLDTMPTEKLQCHRSNADAFLDSLS